MGIFHSEQNQKVQFISKKINIDFIYENINKRNLNSPSDFSIENLKIKAIELYKESLLIKNEKDKYLKLKQAISYDNTNNIILEEYLKIEKVYNNKEYDKNIIYYHYHISPRNYSDITAQKKSRSSVDLILEVFELLKNYKKDNNDFLEDLKEKNKITEYFYKIKNREPAKKANSTYTINSNLELALYEIYLSLFSEINQKIGNLWKIAGDEKLSLKKRYEKISSEDKFDIIIDIIEKQKADTAITLLYSSDFFNIILLYIKDYILELNDVIKKCLEFKDINNDFYIICFIILEIKYMIVNESDAKFTDRIKEYKSENIKDDENPLIKNFSSQIKDFDKYDKNKIIDELKNKKYITRLNELMFNNFIKLEYFNSDNIIKKMMKFINKFNEKISNSATIISALYQFYPELKRYKLFESGFTSNLFKNAIKTSYFFPLNGKRGATTLNDSGTILFFIGNRTIFEEKSLYKKENRILYLMGNLAVFIYTEFHEILGHYLRIILSKIIEYEYISPRLPYNDYDESGECIEALLFEKRILTFNTKQILYLLDINNYNKELEKFKEDFKHVNSKPFSLSGDLKKMLEEIEIIIDEDSLNNDEELAKLVKENNIFKGTTFDVPILHNCVEKFELFSDEDLINCMEKIKKL